MTARVSRGIISRGSGVSPQTAWRAPFDVLSSAASVPGLVLFFLMLFVPLAYQEIKAPILALTIGVALVAAMSRGELRIHPIVLLWTTFMVSVGLFYISLGLIRGNPGSLSLLTVYAVWPVVFTFLLHSVSTIEAIEKVLKVMVVGALAISAYSLSYVFSVLNLIPDALYIPFDQGQRIGFHEGYVDINIHSTNSLIFLVPFLMGCVMTWPAGRASPVSRRFLWFALIVSLAFGILSARRAFWGIIFISPFVVLFLRFFLGRAAVALAWQRVAGIAAVGVAGLIGLFLALQVVFDLTIVDMFQKFLVAFDVTSDEGGGSYRSYQFGQLINDWYRHPVFGTGFGAVVPGYSVSTFSPWSYELFYLALMNQTGVVGAVIYASAFAWVVLYAIRLIREDGRLSVYMVPVLTGTICYMLANTSNPMIAKFDHIWVIFLPIALINCRMLSRRRPGAKPEKRGPGESA